MIWLGQNSKKALFPYIWHTYQCINTINHIYRLFAVIPLPKQIEWDDMFAFTSKCLI